MRPIKRKKRNQLWYSRQKVDSPKWAGLFRPPKPNGSCCYKREEPTGLGFGLGHKAQMCAVTTHLLCNYRTGEYKKQHGRQMCAMADVKHRFTFSSASSSCFATVGPGQSDHPCYSTHEAKVGGRQYLSLLRGPCATQ